MCNTLNMHRMLGSVNANLLVKIWQLTEMACIWILLCWTLLYSKMVTALIMLLGIKDILQVAETLGVAIKACRMIMQSGIWHCCTVTSSTGCTVMMWHHEYRGHCIQLHSAVVSPTQHTHSTNSWRYYHETFLHALSHDHICGRRRMNIWSEPASQSLDSIYISPPTWQVPSAIQMAKFWTAMLSRLYRFRSVWSCGWQLWKSILTCIGCSKSEGVACLSNKILQHYQAQCHCFFDQSWLISNLLV